METVNVVDENGSTGTGTASIQDVMAASDAQLRRSLDSVVRLAERYFDRFDASGLLEMLPPSTPVAVLLRYLRISMEYSNTRQRNLKVSCDLFLQSQVLKYLIIVCACMCTRCSQIVHQLLRTREVNIRTSSNQEGSQQHGVRKGLDALSIA